MTPTLVAEHPMAGTTARLAELLPTWPVRLGTPDGPGWHRYPDLLTDIAVGGLLDALDDRLGGGRALAAQTLVGRVAGPLSTVLAAAVFTERRLPAVEPDGLVLRGLDGGDEPAGLALAGTAMSVLPGDPAAGHPDVSVLPDLAALQLALTTGLHHLFEPLVDTVSRCGRRGRRALWQAVADRIAIGHLLAGKHGGEEDRARRETDATLAGGPRPLTLTVDWLDLEHLGTRALFKRKSVCCLYYKSVEYRDEYCTTCPLLPREESVHRLQMHLAAQAAG